MFTLYRNISHPLLLAAIIISSLSCNHGNVPSVEDQVTITPVTLTRFSIKPVLSSVELPAVSSYLNRNIIRASTTGAIENSLARQGEPVRAGQLLFTIRTREAMALVSNSAADSSLSFKGLINIFASGPGVVSSVTYQKGDFVAEGDELASVSDQGSLVFILEVPFELIHYIDKNRNCAIQLPDKRIIKGTITGKLPEMDILSQTVKYVVKPVAAERIPANLISTMTLIKSVNDSAQVFPKNAVLGNETQTEFWVMKVINDSTAIKVPVNKGYENSEEVEITAPGFRSSDRFLLTGNYGLPDTARISIIKE
jgi:HlyD family secretion protein